MKVLGVHHGPSSEVQHDPAWRHASPLSHRMRRRRTPQGNGSGCIKLEFHGTDTNADTETDFRDAPGSCRSHSTFYWTPEVAQLSVCSLLILSPQSWIFSRIVYCNVRTDAKYCMISCGRSHISETGRLNFTNFRHSLCTCHPSLRPSLSPPPNDENVLGPNV